MEKITHKVGDTVTLKVKVDNLSENYSDVKLSLYKRNTANGFTDLIKEILPSSVENGEFTFIYDTVDFMSKQMTYYGHFFINNNGIILNNYYKIKAKY